MNLSLNWLARYLKSDLSPEETASVLTDIGLEVEGEERVEAIPGGLRGVVTARVLTCEPHPDSDHLHVTSVDVGGPEPLPIVCGAANCRAGLVTFCATVGTVLGADFKIKRSKIRGVESLGMLCAEDELGLGAGHAGIVELPEGTPAGVAAGEYLGLEQDTVLAIGLTPNRSDAASHYGVARDLAAWLRARGRAGELTLPAHEMPAAASAPASAGSSAAVSVVVEDAAGAPRYAGVTIRGCRVAPSPEWMQRSLRAIGVTPKNNLVDITNYVLFELGQPLHAFDAAKIEGGEIHVRTCPEGTRFTTLDGVERTLAADDLMVCSAERPMCLAGVFGGLDSGVSEGTTDIFLESAYFDPVRVRKSARRHALSTDASFRFERGADPDMVPVALARAAALVCELAGGHVQGPVTDLYPTPIGPHVFEASLDRIDALLGIAIPEATVRVILEALEIRVLAENGRVWRVAVPPYRVDVIREADLAEELLRIYGFNAVPVPDRVRSTLTYVPRVDRRRVAHLASEWLTARGFSEIMSNSLTRSAYYEGLEGYPPEEEVRLLNPLSSDLDALRRTLLFNAMEAVSLNVNRRRADLRLYEFGNCYFRDPAVESTVENPVTPYAERYRLGVVVMGLDVAPSWNRPAATSSFFTLRAEAEGLLARLGMDIWALKAEPLVGDGLLADGIALMQGSREVARLGVVGAAMRGRFDIRQDLYFMELDVDAVVRAAAKRRIAVEELPKYPEVRRDLALLIDRSVTFAALRAAALEAEKKLLRSVTLFDVYEGDKLPEGKKSYALGFVLEDRERTLTDTEIDRAMASIAAALEQKTGAEVRR